MFASSSLFLSAWTRLYTGFLDPWFPRLLALAAKASLISFIIESSVYMTDSQGGYIVQWTNIDWTESIIIILILLSEFPPFWRWRDGFDTFYRVVALLFFFFGSMVWIGLDLEYSAMDRGEIPVRSIFWD